MAEHNKGRAPIKPAFLFLDPTKADYRNHHQTDPEYLVSKAADEQLQKKLEETLHAKRPAPQPEPSDQQPEPQQQQQQQKSKRGGQNKNRKEFNKIGNDEIPFCSSFAQGSCSYENCKYSHDVEAYLKSKGEDIGPRCPQFRAFGICKYGIRCRFAGDHSVTDEHGVTRYDVTNQELIASNPPDQLNRVSKKALDNYKKAFGKKDSEAVLDAKTWMEKSKDYNTFKASMNAEASKAMKEALGPINTNAPPPAVEKKENKDEDQSDIDVHLARALPYLPADRQALFEERTRQNKQLDEEFLARCGHDAADKKPFEWKGTYLAPLTNVGNLPFRRVAKGFGVDITCAEMALVNNLTTYAPSEWALTRRHPSEDKFGIQIASNLGLNAARAGDALRTLLFENPENRHPTLAPFDFVDINCGCPIDLLYKTGAGSALMTRRNRLRDIIFSLHRTLPGVPVSVKLRTGVLDDHNSAHRLIPAVAEWGAKCVALHGRSRQQRYTKTANWEYIRHCAKIARASGIPLYGNGDVLGFEDYYAQMPYVATRGDEDDEEEKGKNVDGVMVGRGALIKPWIFTEIKEEKVWDISGRERFDLFRQFAEFGLEHWGSDTKGVNLTRTYLLDWMSFTHRYIPVGLLEVLPQKFNDRPDAFFGRDYYETLLASPKVSDWIYITEKILGKAPEGFSFIPKHKSSSYEGDAADDSVHG